MYNDTDETPIISRWKNDLESCARDFLRFFTIQQFEQQFHPFLVNMRQMTFSHVNQINPNLEHQSNNPPFYNSSENSAGYRGRFNHGEIHSQIHNVTSHVENYEHPEGIQSKQGNSDMASEPNVIPLPGSDPMNISWVNSEFQPGIYPRYPVVDPIAHPNFPPEVNPVIEPNVNSTHPTGIYITINPLIGADNFFKNESNMDHNSGPQIWIDPDCQAKVQRSMNSLNEFIQNYKANGLFEDPADNSRVDLPVNIVDDSSDDDFPDHLIDNNSDADSSEDLPNDFDDLSDISSNRSSGYSSDHNNVELNQ